MESLPTATKLDRLRERTAAGDKLACLTAYDYPTARLVDEAGVDLILTGDTLGMMVYGFEDTIDVTMTMMEHHVMACSRGVRQALLVGDLPYHAYETPEDAVTNARRLMTSGAEAVKLEGGLAQIDKVRAITGDGIPFLGHIGILPQNVREEGGYRKKGKTDNEQQALLRDALALEEAGAFAMVLEGIVPKLAAQITTAVGIPTIGIGSGADCSGQILVVNDLIGSYPWFCPPFVQPRADVAGETSRAVGEFVAAVRDTSKG